MDKFGVPKKINRHVLKAVYQLNEEGLKFATITNICDFVRSSMKNNIPVADFKSKVVQSLQNLYKLGVIAKQGAKYYKNIEIVDSPLSVSKHINTNAFLSSMKWKRDRESSNLNPNKRRLISDEDSGSDPGNFVKRRKGLNVDLPKARKHFSDIEQESCSSHGCSSEYEKKEYEIIQMNIEAKPQFAEVCETAMVGHGHIASLLHLKDCRMQNDNLNEEEDILEQTNYNKDDSSTKIQSKSDDLPNLENCENSNEEQKQFIIPDPDKKSEKSGTSNEKFNKNEPAEGRTSNLVKPDPVTN